MGFTRFLIDEQVEKVLQQFPEIVVDSNFMIQALAVAYTHLYEYKPRNPLRLIWKRMLLKEIQKMQAEYAQIPDN